MARWGSNLPGSGATIRPDPPNRRRDYVTRELGRSAARGGRGCSGLSGALSSVTDRHIGCASADSEVRDYGAGPPRRNVPTLSRS